MRLGDAEPVPQRYHVGCRFFDDIEAIGLELAEDERLAGPGGAGKDDLAGHASLLM
jgi:hypothetical protein